MNLPFSTHLKLFKKSQGAWSCDLSKIDQIQKIKKSKNRKIGKKSNLISIENFRIFGFSEFRFSKIFNWNQVTFFDFRFSIFLIWSIFDRSLLRAPIIFFSNFRCVEIMKRWDSCAFNASKITQNKIPTAKRQHQTWAKKSDTLLRWNDKNCTQFHEI